MSRRRYVFWGLATASLALAIVLIAPYWILQAVALTAIASAVAVDSIRRADGDSGWEVEPTLPRSRVSHYALIAGIEDSTRLVQTASSPFERTLLGIARWSKLSQKELVERSRNTPEDDDSVGWDPKPT